MRFQRKGNTPPPVEEGEVVDLKCISIGKKGDGIFKLDGFVIIVPKTEVNKTYKLKMTKVMPTIGFGEVMQSEGVEAPKEEEKKDTEDFGEEEKKE